MLSAASLMLACHAHGDQAVSAIDHEVKVEFFRHATQDATVELRITNSSSQPICLGPATFDPSSFSVKMDQGMTQTRLPAVQGAGCELLGPGAVVTRSVNAGLGFSRLELQTGRMCYHYAFASAPTGPTTWQASSLVCE